MPINLYIIAIATRMYFNSGPGFEPCYEQIEELKYTIYGPE